MAGGRARVPVALRGVRAPRARRGAPLAFLLFVAGMTFGLLGISVPALALGDAAGPAATRDVGPATCAVASCRVDQEGPADIVASPEEEGDRYRDGSTPTVPVTLVSRPRTIVLRAALQPSSFFASQRILDAPAHGPPSA